MIAGNASPKILKQNAPNNDMNNPKRGTAAAKRTKSEKLKIIKIIHKNDDEFNLTSNDCDDDSQQ